ASGDEAALGLRAAAFGFVEQDWGGISLAGAADLPDHDDRFSRLVGEQHLENLDELGAFHGITADADGGGLAEPLARGLVDGLIRERARARDDADLAGLEDISRHDADLALARGHHARAVRPDQA